MIDPAADNNDSEFKEILDSNYASHKQAKQFFALKDTEAAITGRSAASQPPPATIRHIIFNDRWIMIQKNTFTNWINEQLKNEAESVDDIRLDLTDGVKLVKLINALQMPNPKVSRRYFKTPKNEHQCLENISLALNAIMEDGIKLVNIGKCLAVNNLVFDANLNYLLIKAMWILPMEISSLYLGLFGIWYWGIK